MSTLILGSEGFVGKPFFNYLKTLGKNVIGIDIKHNSNEDLRLMKLDFTDIEYIYFLAWDVGGAKYLYNKDTQLSQINWNLKILQNVMPQIQKAGVPFLFVSSQLAEESINSYGVTKRLGEIWTHLLGGVHVRLWNVYGHSEVPSQRSHVISDFIYDALVNGEINMMTTGEEKRQFIHIEDVCRGLLKALELNLQGIYDITSFEWVSILDVAKIISRETGAKINIGKEVGATPITPLKGCIPDWFPTITLEQGLKDMIRKEKING